MKIEAAKLPAEYKSKGDIVISGTDKLDIPDIGVNIGGHGEGYIIRETLDWDPVANEDGSLGGAMALGDDIYIYAIADSSGVAQLVASKNISVPDGYTASESRRIGGFHYGRWRPEAYRFDENYSPSTQIVPTSVWDQNHRPTCDPSGMVEIIQDEFWADIYLNSEDGSAWPNTVPLSRYNATPLSGAEGYARFYDYPRLAENAGKRLPYLWEFYRYAEGSPQGHDNDNDTAWSDTSNTDRTTTGAVAKAVSTKGVVDCAGNLWEPTLDHYDETGTHNYDRTITENGKDSTEARGEIYHVRWRFWLAGQNWTGGVQAGALSGSSNSNPEYVNSYTGLRCVASAQRRQ